MPSVVLQPNASAGVDTMVYSGSPTSNYGTNAAMQVGDGSAASSNALRGLIAFPTADITGALPSGYVLTGASLSLYETGAGTTRSSGLTDTCNLHRVLVNWSESQATYYLSATGVNWNASGCAGDGTDRVAAASSTVQLARSTTASGWKTWTGLLTDVQLWINASASNYGWVIQCPTKEFIGVADTDYRTFASSDYTTDTSYRPKLTLDYVLGPRHWWMQEG